METKLFRLGRQKTMNKIGADIPVSLWNRLSISSLVMKLEGFSTSLLITILGRVRGPRLRMAIDMRLTANDSLSPPANIGLLP